MFYYLIALFVILLDQTTKWLIVSKMQFGESITIIENVLYITSHRNSGAAWGILQGQMWLFYVITLIVIGAVIFYMQKAAKGNGLLKVSLAFILGGAIGNFIDRVFRQQVVDFIHTYIFGYNFPVFNIADSSLVIGVILLMIQMLLEDRKSKEKSYGENGTHRS